MIRNRKRESPILSFSYLDLIFLLLAGLLVSLGIYVANEEKRAEKLAPVYQVQASVRYREQLSHAVPKAGEDLFDEKGNKIGFIDEVEFYEAEGEKEFLVRFSLYGANVREGEDFSLETAFSKGKARILSIAEKEGETLE